MKAQKWFIHTIAVLVLLLLAAGLLVIIIDPYYHYHKPLTGINYEGFNVLYSNDGMLKNFDYNALIAGTSITLGFSEEEASSLFHENFIRTSFPGEGFMIIGQEINTGLDHQPNLKHVIYALDEQFFVSAPDFEGQPDSNYPRYLYDDNPWNDTYYLYNIGTWKEAMIPTIVSSIYHPVKSSSGSSDEERVSQYFSHNDALSNYVRVPRSNLPIDPAETEQFYSFVDGNIEKNVIPMISEHPDVRFDIFLPPYSILYWDNIHQHGQTRLDRRIDMEERALNLLLPYDNVHLYSFHCNGSLTTNLNYYSDEVHYKPEVCSKILHWVRNGEYEITQDNCDEYIHNLRDFLTNYDYDALFS